MGKRRSWEDDASSRFQFQTQFAFGHFVAAVRSRAYSHTHQERSSESVCSGHLTTLELTASFQAPALPINVKFRTPESL